MEYEKWTTPHTHFATLLISDDTFGWRWTFAFIPKTPTSLMKNSFSNRHGSVTEPATTGYTYHWPPSPILPPVSRRVAHLTPTTLMPEPSPSPPPISSTRLHHNSSSDSPQSKAQYEDSNEFYRNLSLQNATQNDNNNPRAGSSWMTKLNSASM